MEAHNAAIVRCAVDNIWNRGELDLADSLFAATYVNHGGLIPDLVRGPEAIKISVVLFRTAFPELCIAIEGLTANGDTVELHWAADGNSIREREPEQRSDQHARLTGTTLSTLAGGKIVESWTDWDSAGALQRLETIPLETRA